MEQKHVLNQYPHITETDDKEVKAFLNTLSDEELYQIVIDYQEIHKTAGFENPLTLHMSWPIYGFCSRMHPAEQIMKYISSYFDMFPYQIEKYKTQENTYIRVCIPLIANNIALIKHAFRLFEYRLCSPAEELKSGHFAWLVFAPKDDTTEIKKMEAILYFLIPYRKRGCIKHFGYLPYKNELFSYHRNTYFLKGSTDIEEIKRICTIRRDANPDISNINRFALYAIDLNQIPYDAPLYLDPFTSFGIYTPYAISQDAIISMQELIV